MAIKLFILLQFFLSSLLFSDQNITQQCPEEKSFSGILKQMEENDRKSQNIISQISISGYKDKVDDILLNQNIDIKKYADSEYIKNSTLPAWIFFIPIGLVFIFIVLLINFIARKISKN